MSVHMIWNIVILFFLVHLRYISGQMPVVWLIGSEYADKIM